MGTIIETETITREIPVCDICGKPFRLACNHFKCRICGKDICGSCMHETNDGYTNDGYTHFCKNCFSKGSIFIESWVAECIRHDKAVEHIIQQWKNMVK
jgi:hypothetical protein